MKVNILIAIVLVNLVYSFAVVRQASRAFTVIEEYSLNLIKVCVK